MFYYTYVLKSTLDKKLYIGVTKDLKTRLEKHNLGKVKSTKYRRPLNLVYYEACKDYNKAVEREKQLKTGYGRKYLKKRI